MEAQMNQTGKTTIKYSVGLKLSYVIGTVFCLGLSAYLWTSNEDWKIIAIFLFIGLMSLASIFFYSGSITYDEMSIEYKTIFKPSKSITWPEIQNLKSSALSSSFHLLDGHGNKLMKIDKNMKNSEQFVVMLANKCPNIFVPEPNHTFRPNTILRIGLLIFLFGIGGYFIYEFIKESLIVALVVGLFFIGFGLYNLLFSPNEIILQTDRLVIKSMVKTAEVMLSNIANVEYEMYMVRRGTRYFRTTLTLADGKQVPFASLGGGTLPAFLYIRSWWKQGQKRE